MLAVIVTAS